MVKVGVGVVFGDIVVVVFEFEGVEEVCIDILFCEFFNYFCVVIVCVCE